MNNRPATNTRPASNRGLPPATPPGTAIRALVVEDDPSWQQILVEILNDMGLEVDLASSYADAVERLRRDPHRLAILDLSLGGADHHNQDGLSVAEAVRRQDPECMILFLTGFATVELAVQVMKEWGAFTCLRKETFRRSEFRQVVSEALAQAALPRSAEVRPVPKVTGATGLATHPATGALAVVVEDDAGWRGLLTELLEDAGYQVRTSGGYLEAVGLLKREQFQVAVVDLSLASSLATENTDGYRLLTGMQKSNVPVIVVTGYADPQRIEQAYKERLIVACLEKQSFDRAGFRDTLLAAQASHDPVLDSLTDREREVLVLLARGLTNKEIAHELTITPNTVKRHLKSLFLKLEVNTRSAASARAINLGIV